ncbi:MAG: Hint domain-containing protein, partial [Gemmobacter sp.]
MTHLGPIHHPARTPDPWHLPGIARPPGAMPVGALVLELVALPATPTVLLHVAPGPASTLGRILVRGCAGRGVSVAVETAAGRAALSVAWPDAGAARAGLALGWDGARVTLAAAPGGLAHLGPPQAAAPLGWHADAAATVTLTGRGPGFWAHPAATWHALRAGPNRPLPAALLSPATRIDTPAGPRRAGDLRPGDAVCTLGAGLRPIASIRHHWLAPRGTLAPIRLRAGYCPTARDILVGPRQPVLLDGPGVEDATGRDEILIRAADLAQTRLARAVEGDGAVPMLALELDAPALILADGMALSCATKAMAGPAVP